MSDPTLRVLRFGRSAVLVEPSDPGVVLALAAAARDLPDVREVVPAARTVLIEWTSTAAARSATDTLAALAIEPSHATPASSEPILLSVHYDGADVDEAAHELGMGPDELVRRHSAGEYVVAFCGFAPGFAYLAGLDERLHVPRLPEPRTRVPAGAVGIAGEFTGIYPRPSPGGWRLLGRTDAKLWDVSRTPPALLTPGTRVRFRPA